MAAAKTKARATAADLLREPDRYEFCEVWDGALVVREPSNLWPEEVAGAVIEALRRHVVPHRLGIVTGSQGAFYVAQDPDWVLVPDVAFVAKERVSDIPKTGFAPFAPDLAVEVRSPSDPWSAVLSKAGVWLAHGVRLVWAIDPQARLVTVLTPGDPPIDLRLGQVLTGSPVLPRFRLHVEALFRSLPP